MTAGVQGTNMEKGWTAGFVVGVLCWTAGVVGPAPATEAVESTEVVRWNTLVGSGRALPSDGFTGIFPAIAAITPASDNPPDNAGPATGATDTAIPAESAAKDNSKAQSKERYKLALFILVVGLTVFWLGIALITCRRWLQRVRREAGLGRKSPPTEYIDAWSQYRLNDLDDLPDETDTSGEPPG